MSDRPPAADSGRAPEPPRVARAGAGAVFAVLAAIVVATALWFGLGGRLEQQPLLCVPDAGTTVCILPAAQNVTAGNAFSVQVVIDDVTNLGAFEATIEFDPSLVDFTSGIYGGFLGSTGRAVNCFSPSDQGSRVRFACVTTPPGQSGPPGPLGPDGAGVLVTANFLALAPGTSPLNLTSVIVTDIAGVQIPSLEQDAQVTVDEAFTPTPCPGGVCDPTSTRTATATRTPTPGPGPATTRIDPASQTQLVGSQFTVDVLVDDVTNLGAYQFSVAWDQAVMSFVSVVNGDFIGSTGRAVFCPPPAVGTNTMNFGCVTTGSSIPGPNGSGLLARITFSADASSAGSAKLIDLFNVGLSTPLGAGISTAVVDGTVTIATAPTATPTPCPGPCPTATITPTSTATLTPTPTPIPVPCAPGAGTRVCIQPASQAVGTGTNFGVAVAVEAVSNLGAFQFTIAFDPSMVAFNNVTVGPFLGSTGRSVNCVVPSITASSMSFNCVTLGDVPPAPSGNGVLANVSFLAVGAGTSALDLQNVLLSDPQGGAIPATDQDGSVEVLLGDTPTPTATPTSGPSHTPTPTVPPPSTITRVSPVSQDVTAGANFTVEITIEGVTDLASYEWQLVFDPAVIGYVSVTNSTFLGSTGRFVFCPPPILDTGSVRFGCVTSGLTPPPPSGSGVLSVVTFTALVPGVSALDLTLVSLSDPLAVDIPTQIFDGSVTVVAVGPSTSTPTATVTVTATPTPTP